MKSEHLEYVAKSEAVKKWKRVCRRLGVSEDVIAQSAEYVAPKAFCKSLTSWMDEQGDKATLSILYQVLNNSGYQNVGLALLSIEVLGDECKNTACMSLSFTNNCSVFTCIGN